MCHKSQTPAILFQCHTELQLLIKPSPLAHLITVIELLIIIVCFGILLEGTMNLNDAGKKD
uniref:Ion transport domain-containing protein n=1 Tax=Anguilla anguilla TaxID=7936 RepID=A0A0E9W3G0_ANGAN